jgi:mannose-6-phosphate isomerase-like protein (cupin superfamily)
MPSTLSIHKQSIDSPTEVRTFPHGQVEVVDLGDMQFTRTVFQPGWKWSNDVKPIAQTEFCEVHHHGFVVSGRMHVEMKDGTSSDLMPGDVVTIEPGHDAWVIGDEPSVMFDFGAEDANYAKPKL